MGITIASYLKRFRQMRNPFRTQWRAQPLSRAKHEHWCRAQSRNSSNMQAERCGVRYDVVVYLSRGNGDQRILEIKLRILRLLRHPYLVQTLATDATCEVGVELTRLLNCLTRKMKRLEFTSIFGRRRVNARSTGRAVADMGNIIVHKRVLVWRASSRNAHGSWGPVLGRGRSGLAGGL